MRAILRAYLGLLLPLQLGCYLAWLPLVRAWSWSPSGFVALLAAMALLAQWSRASVPRRPLDESHAELRGWVETLAELAGVRLRAVSVAESEPPVALGGEVVFDEGRLAEGGSTLLFRAARQLASMTAPAAFAAPSVVLVGAGVGAVLVVHHRLGPGFLGAVVAFGLLVILAVVVVWRLSGAMERREQAVEARARELVAALRDARPEAFADLAARQGLGPPAAP